MELKTNNGVIDTKNVEYIQITRQSHVHIKPEFFLIARVNGKDYELENTRDIDELKVYKKYKALELALLQEQPQRFVSAPHYHLVNVKIANNCVLEGKFRAKMFINLSNGENLVKKFNIRDCQPALQNRVLEERLR